METQGRAAVRLREGALPFILAQRIWQGVAGLITVVIITMTLSHEQQGWYYTFLGIAALYSIFEMGLSGAILQVSAHLFVKLHWLQGGHVEGEAASEFNAFVASSVRIYGLISIVFVVFSSLVGAYMFGHRASLDHSGLLWHAPWPTLLTLTAMNMMTLPFFSVVEGSGEITEVYQVRLIQGIAGSVLCWFVLLHGGALWATTMLPLASLVVFCCWLVKKKIGLISIVIKPHVEHTYDWMLNIWPHQWRLGLNSISLFMMSQLATPILFYYYDPVIAGQMGLSLTLAHMLGIVAQSWIARRVPMMSQAVARREWHLFDTIFRQDLLHSILIFLLGMLVLILGYQFLVGTKYVERLLPFWQFVGLLGFVFLYHLCGALSTQLRSFRREPLMWVNLVGSLIIVIGSLFAAHQAAVGGMVVVMVATQLLFVLPLSLILWRRYNLLWRGEMVL